MLNMQKTGCICENLPPQHDNYTAISYLGQDLTNGRFADVTIQECKFCKRKWLKYFVEFEYRSNSGRFYMGIADDKELQKITPENSISYIENLEWYIYGGSYFSTTGKFGKGKAFVDD